MLKPACFLLLIEVHVVVGDIGLVDWRVEHYLLLRALLDQGMVV